MSDRLLKIGEAARLLGCTTDALRRREASGELVPREKSAKGTRYYAIEDLQPFLPSAAAANPRAAEGDGLPASPSDLEALLGSVGPPATHAAARAMVQAHRDLLEYQVARRQYIHSGEVREMLARLSAMLNAAFGDAFCRHLETSYGVDFAWVLAYCTEQEDRLATYTEQWLKRMGTE